MTQKGRGHSDTLLREAAASLDLALPARQLLIERFFLHRCLGTGGFGVVYDAEDLRDGGRVALKMLRRVDALWLSRFKREFRTLQGVSHPNLVSFDELFGSGEDWFFTMELIDGVDFLQFVTGRERPLESQSESGALPRRSFDERANVGSCNERRLRHAARQLLEGLAALHAMQKVHRDIKPSNVLVTSSERVVLIDFGLMLEPSYSIDLDAIGTPAYMAPEQAASREVGPAADLYAVGVMLYEALTGRKPIDGSPRQIAIEKQTHEPSAPSALVPDVPPDLDRLCLRLLQRAPEQRPSALEALASLDERSGSAAPSSPRSRPGDVASERPESTRIPFIGRVDELAKLRNAFELSAHGHFASVLITGASGIGKTRLLRHFSMELAARHPEALVFHGRCHEREAIPYKAIDGLVEALGASLARMPAAEVSILLPKRRALLGRLFPTLLRVPQLAREFDKDSLANATPHELRQQAFGELRELFMRVAVARPLVLVIDDLQWADDDGLRALEEIVRAPDSPPLLLLGTLRTGGGAREVDRKRLQACVPELLVIDLGNLSHAEARALTSALLLQMQDRETSVDRIVLESDGHPLFLEELARHAAVGAKAPVEIRLDDVIWARVSELEPDARTVVELAAVAGKALPQELSAKAAGLSPVAFQRQASAVRSRHLIRSSGSGWADTIDTYHDRVRESVCARMSTERAIELHRAIAEAVEASTNPDVEFLASHFRAAGAEARAAKYAALAGDEALRTFAFDRAAAWYEQAVELYPVDHPARQGLQIKLGEALALAGRGARAAAHFEQAAAQAPPMLALELRRRVAEQLLTSGHFDRGLEASGRVLSMIGMHLPSTRLGTQLALIWFTILLRLRGLRFRARPAESINPSELVRIDTCWSIAKALAFADTMVGFVFSQRALRLALRAGDVERIVSPLAMTATFHYVGGANSRRGAHMLKLALSWSHRQSNVHDRVVTGVAVGLSRYFRGEIRQATQRFLRALHLAEGSHGLVFQRVALESVLVEGLALLGRYRQLREHQREALRDAQARGDVYAMARMQVGAANLTWLVEDRPDLAQAALDSFARSWWPHGYHREHYLALMAQVSLHLYTGDVERAFGVACEFERRTRASLLWRFQVWRLHTLYARGSSALALIERGLGDQNELLCLVSSDASAIERERRAWMLPFAELLRAGLDAHAGDRARAVERLTFAERGLRERGLMGYAVAAGERRARLRNDSASEIESAHAWFRSEHVQRPERLLAILVPGL